MFWKNKADFMVMTIIFIIFIGAATGGVLLHIQNQSIATELKQKRQQLASLKQEHESVQSDVFRNRETKTRVENQLTLLAPFDREQQEIFKGDLERLVSEHHVKIAKSELLSPSLAKKDNPEYRISQWQLVLIGDYRGLIGFLEALPCNTRLAMISQLKITSEYRNGNQYLLTAYLTLDIISK
jgi:hypothetical protein